MALHDALASAAYYDADPDGFARRYATVTFETVHPLLSRHLPPNGMALDIGAGSGRDARALAASGLTVTAVEPSHGLRTIGAAASSDILWVDDRLPLLACLTDEAGHYDVVLCSAVLMLVAPADLARSFETMARLLTPKGILAINIRAAMPTEPADLFFSHADADIMSAAQAVGLDCIDRVEAADALGRAPYRWRNFIFSHRG